MAKQYSTKDVSKELEVSEQTVRLWSKTFQIPYTKSSGNIRFSQSALEIFETVKALRSENSGFDTIKRHIKKSDLLQTENKALKPVEIEKKPKLIAPQPAADQTEAFVKVIQNLENVIDNSIQKSIKEQNELSERYARATYRIGELETTVKFLNEQIKKLESDHTKLEETHTLTLKEKQEEIKELKTPPAIQEPEAPKSWFKKLFS